MLLTITDEVMQEELNGRIAERLLMSIYQTTGCARDPLLPRLSGQPLMRERCDLCTWEPHCSTRSPGPCRLAISVKEADHPRFVGFEP